VNDSAIPIATDPLGAIRMELVGAARRRAATRERRGRATTVVATALVTLVAVAGAGAAMNVSTGIPELDRLLGTISAPHRAVDDQRPPGIEGAPTAGDLRAGSANASQPLEVPWGDGSRHAVGAAFVNESGQICFALSEPHGEGVGEARGNVSGCGLLQAFSRRLADDAALVAGSTSADGRSILSGYARPDVRSLVVSGADGPLEVELTPDTWTPDVPGGTPLRVFVAVGAPAEGQQSGDLRDYAIEARLADGRTVRARP
jgi:hypothetical protein